MRRWRGKYFGEPKNAVGQLLSRGSGTDVKFDIEIVGVVGDTKHAQMRIGDRADGLWRPYFQDEHPQAGFMQYYVRTWQAPEAAENDHSAYGATNPARNS